MELVVIILAEDTHALPNGPQNALFVLWLMALSIVVIGWAIFRSWLQTYYRHPGVFTGPNCTYFSPGSHVHARLRWIREHEDYYTN